MKLSLFSILALLFVAPAFAADPWRLCSRVEGGRETSMLQYEMTLKIEEDAVFGQGGCNSYGGEVVRDSEFLFQNIRMTQMACGDENGNYDEDLMNAEQLFVADLSRATAIIESGNGLKIETADQVELRFALEGQCR